jgi:hypothetical protein
MCSVPPRDGGGQRRGNMPNKRNQAANRKEGIVGPGAALTRRRGPLAGEDQNVRYTAMCVPGDRDDGSDSGWHVYDVHSRASRKVGVGNVAGRQATDAAREANRAWYARQGQGR